MGKEPQQSTKVYYYLDGSTPYVSTVAVPPESITLGDFKVVFGKQNYKYFCKELDPVLQREVKVELTSDGQKLRKSGNGLFELVLLPIVTAVGESGTLPRASSSKVRNKAFDVKRRDLDRSDNGYGAAKLRMSDPSSVFSRRAGERLAEETSSSPTSEDVDDDDEEENEDEEPGESLSSSCYKKLGSIPSANGRKLKGKAYVPSTVSSVSSESNSLPRLDEIKIPMVGFSCLGIKVVDHDGGIFVCSIRPGSAADHCGLLDSGDQIIQLNGMSFEHFTIQQAISKLKEAAASRKTITIIVAKRPLPEPKSEGPSMLCETLPLDVSNWVEATTNNHLEEPFSDIDSFNNNDGASVVTSDEERAAYADRRNGVGACLVPALLSYRNQQQVVDSTPPPLPIFPTKKENDENELLAISLTTDTDVMVILKRMVHPKSGLEIANRKWLKIPFPNSFIGNELIDWLFSNVSGFPTKKAAYAFADSLLKKGFIKHILGSKSFDKKRYYFFDDAIIAYRNQILSQQTTALSSHHQGPQTSGIPAFMTTTAPQLTAFGVAKENSYLLTNSHVVQPCLSQQRPHLAMSHPALPSGRSPYYPQPPGLANWPISPIVSHRPTSGTRNCDSPQTNEYASMIHGEINSNYAPIPLGGGRGGSISPPPNTPSANSSTALIPSLPLGKKASGFVGFMQHR